MAKVYRVDYPVGSGKLPTYHDTATKAMTAARERTGSSATVVDAVEELTRLARKTVTSDEGDEHSDEDLEG